MMIMGSAWPWAIFGGLIFCLVAYIIEKNIKY